MRFYLTQPVICFITSSLKRDNTNIYVTVQFEKEKILRVAQVFRKARGKEMKIEYYTFVAT